MYSKLRASFRKYGYIVREGLPVRTQMTARTTLVAALLVSGAANVSAQAENADARAARIEAAMTDDERLSLVWGYMPMPSRLGPAPTPPGIKPSAGYYPPNPRLGVPGLYETDASLGVTNPKMLRQDDVATALPSGLALAATFNVDLAQRAGQMIGAEARAKGFNVLLGGGVNLTRDWFGGRNFEYLGEDPLLAGLIGGASIKGIQSNGVVSTAKHFVLNSQESVRHSLDARISEAALRQSDLLAFQIALEVGKPGAIMCAYNKLNGVYGCGNDWLLNKVLRRDWGFKGWVMSDWGATHGPDDLVNGLDQESGAQLDKKVWFDGPLRAAIAAKQIDHAALSQSVRRILRSVFAVGADRPAPEATIDYARNSEVSLEAARQGIVLLKNASVLPLADKPQRILVVGRYADKGIWSGGGSSQVIPSGGPAVRLPYGGSAFLAVNGYQVLTPSSPLAALRERLPTATFEFDTGYVPELAAARAAKADTVIVLAAKWQVESLDSGSLALPEGQDDLIAKLVAANPRTVVVLETGNPTAMPWLERSAAVVQAWFSGQRGGEAIADVISGKVNPSGRLPMTFPRDAAQSPRPVVPGLGLPDEGVDFQVDYHEGADVGYRWYARTGAEPLFAFGHGLSYTRFEHNAPSVDTARGRIGASVVVRNAGARAGSDVPQLYLVAINGKPVRRLAGFARVDLLPGETVRADINVDPRLIADWVDGRWVQAGGEYAFAIGRSAVALGPVVKVRLRARTFGP